jgi:hypothetical protein
MTTVQRVKPQLLEWVCKNYFSYSVFASNRQTRTYDKIKLIPVDLVAELAMNKNCTFHFNIWRTFRKSFQSRPPQPPQETTRKRQGMLKDGKI